MELMSYTAKLLIHQQQPRHTNHEHNNSPKLSANQLNIHAMAKSRYEIVEMDKNLKTSIVVTSHNLHKKKSTERKRQESEIEQSFDM